MDPVTGLYALAAFQIFSGAQQAESIRKNAELSQQVNDMNAKYAELDAYNAEISGYSNVARYENVIDSTVSQQKSALAANDTDVNFGTASQIQAETKLNGFLNKLDIKNQAHAQALGYMNQARNYRLAGEAAVAQGELNANATQNAALINAGGTVLSGYARSRSAKQAVTVPSLSLNADGKF